MNINEIESIFKNNNFNDFKWIKSSNIKVAHWVRMKCKFGCPSYGKNSTCPPETLSVNDCKDFFNEYENAVIFRFKMKFTDLKEMNLWNKKINTELLNLEREVFLSGYQKSFIFYIGECNLCSEKCTGKRTECRMPKSARPSPEAMAVDVFSTVRNAGYDIEVLKSSNQYMSRFAILMIN